MPDLLDRVLASRELPGMWQHCDVGRHIVEVVADSAAPPEAVWEVITDIARWKDWGPFSNTYLGRDGDPPNGMGAIRVYVVGPFRTQEEVVGFDAPGHFAYRVVSGFPARDYRADVTLDLRPGGGTSVRWRAEFDGKPRGTGWLLRIALIPFLGYLARKTGQVAAAPRP